MKLEIRVDDRVPREMLQRAPDFFAKRLAFAIERGAQEIARDARERAPKALSTLTDSIRASRVSDLHWVVAPGVVYGAYVEAGRPAGRMPGVSNGLLEWVKLKIGGDGKALDRLGFVIARAIGRHGIKPQPFMRPAFEAKSARVVELANAAMREAVASLNGGGRVV